MRIILKLCAVLAMALLPFEANAQADSLDDTQTTQGASGPKLEVANTVSEGQEIKVRFEDPSPDSQPWITIVLEGAGGGVFGEYHYTGRQTSGEVVFSPVQAGNYEIRFHGTQSSTAPISTAKIVVEGASEVETERPSLQVVDKVVEGMQILVGFADPSPTPQAWITIVPKGAAGAAFGEYHYTGGQTSGEVVFGPVQAGTYEIRFHSTETSTAPISTATVLVALPSETEPVLPSLQVPETVPPGEQIIVRFSDPIPGYMPYIIIVPEGTAPEATADATHHRTRSTGSRRSGELRFRSLPRGSYEVRFYTDLDSKAPAAVAALNVALAASARNASDRQWYARTTCQSPTDRSGTVDIEIEFTISPASDTTKLAPFEAKMTIGTEPAVSTRTTSISFVGEPDPSVDGRTTFVRHRILRNGALLKTRLERFTFAEESGAGEFPGVECKPFSATEQTPEDLRLVPSVASPENGGTYFVAKSERDRCEAIIAWTNRLNDEYPGRDFFRSIEQGDEWRKVRLFADHDFVPVFGQPYDQMPLTERRSVAQATQVCMSDPFTRDRMEAYSSAARTTLIDDPGNQDHYSGYDYTVFAIRRIREARNSVEALLDIDAADAEAREIVNALEQVSAARAIIDENQKYFWPSELSELRARIAARSQDIGLQAAAAARLTIDQAPKEQDRIEMITEFLSTDTIRNALGASAWAEVERNLLQIQRESSDKLVAPLMETVSEQPATLEGIHEIEQTLLRDFAEFSVIPSDFVAVYREKIRSELDIRLSAVVVQELATLDAFSSSKSSLQEMSDWFQNFSQVFARFDDTETISAANAAYLDRRENLLEALYDEYSEDLESASTQEDRQQLLLEYLTDERDFTLPIALEYQLLAQ